MKAWLSSIVLASLACRLTAATTINPANHFAYGANLGWMDWRGDVANGAVIGEFVCSGFIYAANVGWIHLGDGTPANGIRYQNNAATDFGLNHDGAGNLTGYAYGANIGWLTFTNRDATGASFDGPKVDLLTGTLRGFVWSANCGWISLSNAQAHVQTDTLQMGADTDGDGLPDDWERLHAGNLATLTGAGDNDGDGVSNAAEYIADTDPLDPNSRLHITLYTASAAGSPADITWTSRPTRLYHVRERTNVEAGPWSDVGLGLILPDTGATTTRNFSDSPSPRRFFGIEAVKPLSP